MRCRYAPSCTHSLRHRFTVPLFFLLFFLPFTLLAAGKASIKEVRDLYRSNRKSIEKNGFFEVGNLVFLRGEILWDQEDFCSDEDFVPEMTLLEAQSQLNKIIFLHTKWPDSISEDLRESLKTTYLRIKKVKLRVGEFIQVDSGNIKKNGKLISYSVIAIPPKEVRSQRVSYVNLVKAFNEAFNKRDKRLLSSPYLEICPHSNLKSVIDVMAEQSREQYGSTFANILLGHMIDTVGRAHMIGESFTDKELLSLSKTQLFNVLTLMPYDPKVCYIIGKSFTRDGFRRNADLFFLRGTFWISNKKYNRLCYESVRSDPFRAWLSQEQDEDIDLRKRVIDRLSAVDIDFSPLHLILIKNLGNLPVKNASSNSSEFQRGNDAFFSDSPDLKAALELYLKALDKTFSADTCNMVGRCLQLQGEPLLAVPFFRQALMLDIEHPYAGANLASCLLDVGEKEQAMKAAGSALKNPKLSEWGKKQIMALNL